MVEVRANLTVGADGRHSVVRERAKLQIIDLGAPMDVFWMRLSRRPTDPAQTFGHVEPGKIFVMLDREDYWQCAYVIPKGRGEEIKSKGLAAFREEVAALSPFLARPRGGIARLERYKPAHGKSGPAGALVSSGIVVHWRRGACHVADWRRGNQSGHSGRRGCREHPEQQAAARNARRG